MILAALMIIIAGDFLAMDYDASTVQSYVTDTQDHHDSIILNGTIDEEMLENKQEDSKDNRNDTSISGKISLSILLGSDYLPQQPRYFTLEQDMIPEAYARIILGKRNIIISDSSEIADDSRQTGIRIRMSDEMLFCPAGYIISRNDSSIDITVTDRISAMIALYSLDIESGKEFTNATARISSLTAQKENHCGIGELIKYDLIRRKGISAIIEDDAVTKERIEFIAHEAVGPLNKTILRMDLFRPGISGRLEAILNLTPVIFGTGLWSDIDSAEDVAESLSKNGFTVYKIEITGSPYMECMNCTDYRFSDLTNDVIPAFLYRIRDISGYDQFTYIGHSNGCRSMIYCLEHGPCGPEIPGKGNKTGFTGKTVIRNLVGIACPTEFRGNNAITGMISGKSTEAINYLDDNRLDHITFTDVKRIMLDIPLDIVGKEKISANLFKDYLSFISHSNHQDRNFSRILVDNLLIIYGEVIPGSDIIVFAEDNLDLYETINAKNRTLAWYKLDHISIADDERVISDMIEILWKWD